MKNKIVVGLTSDDKYAPYMGIAIQSMCENTEECLHLAIIDNGISSSNKGLINSIVQQFPNISISWHQVDLEKHFCGFNLVRDIPLGTYSRFFFPKLYPNETKLIYFDDDVVFMKDISLVCSEADEKHIIAAVSTLPNDGGNEVMNRLELSKEHRYFNAGLLVINCVKWNEEHIWEKIAEIEHKYHEKIFFGDQDILNKIFDNSYQKLSGKCNATNNEITEDLHKKAVIRHFEGGVKPWKQHPLKIWAKRYKAKYKGLWEFWKVAIRSPFKDELFAKYPVEKWIMERFMEHS